MLVDSILAGSMVVDSILVGSMVVGSILVDNMVVGSMVGDSMVGDSILVVDKEPWSRSGCWCNGNKTVGRGRDNRIFKTPTQKSHLPGQSAAL